MERFKTAVRQGDAAGLHTLLTAHPELRAAIDRPIFASSGRGGGATSFDPQFGSADVQAVLRRYAARSGE